MTDIRTQQTILDHADCRMENSKWSDNMIEDYMGNKRDTLTLLALLNEGALSPKSGAGAPEGVIVSNYSLKYIDTNTNTEYFNPTLFSDSGWVAI